MSPTPTPKTKSTPNDNRKEHFQRVGLVVTSAIYTVLFVGTIFGWGPMQLMLEREGVFHRQCLIGDVSYNDDSICPAQTASLLRLNFVAQLTQLASPLIGYSIDRFTPRKMAFVMVLLHTLGMVAMVVALATGVYNLLYLAFCLIALHTWIGGLMIVHTGLYFEERTRIRVTGFLNSLFDAAGLTYLMFWYIDKAWGDLTMLSVTILGVSLVVYGSALYFWTVAVPVNDLSTTTTTSFHGDNAVVLATVSGIETVDRRECPKDTGIASVSSTTSYVPVAERPRTQQLLSFPFLMFILFFALHVVSSTWTTSTTRDFLAELGDDDHGNRYLSIYTFLHPVSLLGLPLVDYVIGRWGFQGGFQMINFLGLGYTVVKVVSSNLNVQILGFVLFSFYRCFLFSISFSFLPVFLSVNVVGTASGVIFFVVAILSVANIPLASWAVEGLGSFFLPNLIWTCLVIPCIFAAWYLGRFIDYEKRYLSKRTAYA